MAELPATHATLVIERAFKGSPGHAFSFWAKPELKRRWSDCHDNWETLEYGLDFRVGGGEISRLRTPEGVIHAVRSHYLDIVEGRRIVYAYEMSVGAARISASLATVLFVPAASGSTMSFTEQVVFLDGPGDAQGRHDGTELGFDRLALELERALATIQ